MVGERLGAPVFINFLYSTSLTTNHIFSILPHHFDQYSGQYFLKLYHKILKIATDIGQKGD